jgi:hypothetical protein
MDKYETKYFGEIIFNDFGDFLSALIKYNNYSIDIFLDRSIYVNKINFCLSMINKYFEINNITKDAILKNYSKNKVLKKYFKDCFKNFDEGIRTSIFDTNKYKNINIKSVIDKMKYPDFHFTLNDSNKSELEIRQNYYLSKECTFGKSNVLSVNMDINLNILNFEHRLVLIC